ncbi:unnamed protein product [Spodoptera littoralis]|uniref:SCP domain-containing protein n=1 Tax=Spodoptera littoralis TaxID=7109 RepID=A0A9P0IH66_SPOLI|nr:unnamed protein product [Spodoptera littoralis]CAH1647266.1 unnamed protein product [Spodoptera littoralis]
MNVIYHKKERKGNVEGNRNIESDKMRGVVVVLSCVLALAATSSVNYCGASMCGGNNTHTYCQYPEGPSPNCIGYVKVKLRSREKARLLKRFNSGRNKAAAGGLKGFPPAANMLKLHWVEELAREAQRWADQCRPPRRPEERDTCRDLYSLTVGQCVASAIGTTPQRVDFMVDIWNRQSKYYNHSVTRYEPRNGKVVSRMWRDLSATWPRPGRSGTADCGALRHQLNSVHIVQEYPVHGLTFVITLNRFGSYKKR